jgi:hypothetical protein
MPREQIISAEAEDGEDMLARQGVTPSARDGVAGGYPVEHRGSDAGQLRVGRDRFDPAQHLPEGVAANLGDVEGAECPVSFGPPGYFNG